MTMQSQINALLNQVRRDAYTVLNSKRTLVLGTISSFNPNTYAAKVILQPNFGDESTPETQEMPIASVNFSNLQGVLCPPKKGDQCIVGFGNGDLQNGVVLGYIASDQDRPVLVTTGDFLVQFVNGANSVKLKMNSSGTIEIESTQSISIQSPLTTIFNTGQTADFLAKFTELKNYIDNHVHGGVQSGGANTTPPTSQLPSNASTTNTKAS